jgi:hypothetical protein
MVLLSIGITQETPQHRSLLAFDNKNPYSCITRLLGIVAQLENFPRHVKRRHGKKYWLEISRSFLCTALQDVHPRTGGGLLRGEVGVATAVATAYTSERQAPADTFAAHARWESVRTGTCSPLHQVINGETHFMEDPKKGVRTRQ